MKQLIVATAALSCVAGTAFAGGIDRSRISYSILFEEGNYAELSFSRVQPEVSGTYSGAFGPFAGSSTGDMAGDYSSFSLSYKHQFSDRLHLGLFVNSPYGADANYTQGPYTGLAATWDSQQIAGILRYEVTPAISVYGGLRYVKSEAEIFLPASLVGAPYTANGKTEDTGYILGAAFEKPEIALRVALTYESGITHDFPTTETWAPLGGTINTTTRIEMPQSLALDFQSGIAKDTLLFGMIRWAEWSVWEVRPPGYEGVTGLDITSFDNDVITWQLGIGRRLNENLSVFARATYEKANGGIASRLAPTDGSTAIGIGGSYTKDNIKVTAGLEYVQVGDAVDSSGVEFEGNSALGFGVTVGFRF
jgi:long-subunit fatty acid transport protein